MKKVLIPTSKLTPSPSEPDTLHPDCCLIVQLEDTGQDFLKFQLDKNGVILKAIPFQTEIWAGAYVPLTMLKIGEELPIHHPPHINYGYLKHKVSKIITE